MLIGQYYTKLRAVSEHSLAFIIIGQNLHDFCRTLPGLSNGNLGQVSMHAISYFPHFSQAVTPSTSLTSRRHIATCKAEPEQKEIWIEPHGYLTLQIPFVRLGCSPARHSE